MCEEIWKNYKNAILVSSLGRVKSIDSETIQNHKSGKKMVVHRKGRFLKPHLNKTGYYTIAIHKIQDGIKEYISIHRLLGLLFIDIPEELKHIPIEKLHIDHIDGDKTNNSLDNLRWVTPKGNSNNEVTRKRWLDIINSIEHRDKLSKALKARNYHPTLETRKKMSEVAKGRKLSESQKKAISERIRGEKHPNYGKHLRLETRKKISESNNGKRHTEVTKKRLSEARKGIPNEKLRIEVVQVTLDFVFIRTFHYINECKKYGFSTAAVCKCCKNEYGKKRNVYNGYRWMYKSEYEKMLEKELES